MRRRAGIERELASRVDQRVLRWFGHVEKWMSKWRAERGRPRLGWMYTVKVALGNRRMTVEAARQCAEDRKEWRARGGPPTTSMVSLAGVTR